MSIDRHNYETWFLRYIDGECTAAEQAEVEAFVARHPDLGEELDALRTAVLPPEEIVMPARASLFRTDTWDIEALSQDQQELLRYFEGEMNPTEAAAFEARLPKDPLLSYELGRLQPARLQPEAVSMPGKASLYRQAPVRRIGAAWMRWAAAAAVAALAWIWIGRSDGDMKESEAIAVQPSAVTPSPLAPVVQEPGSIIQPAPDNPAADETRPDRQLPRPDMNAQSMLAVHQTTSAADPVRQPVTVAQEVPVSRELPDASLRQPAEALVTRVSIIDVEGVSAPVTLPGAKPVSVVQPEIAAATSAPVAYEDEDADDHLYIGGARLNKQKLRGVFRTVTRTVGRAFEKSSIAQVDTRQGMQP